MSIETKKLIILRYNIIIVVLLNVVRCLIILNPIHIINNIMFYFIHSFFDGTIPVYYHHKIFLK